MTQIKFCGVTCAEDAAAAAAAGARYVGVIFTSSRRQVDVEQARRLLEPVRGEVTTVGVFGRESPADVVRMARVAGVEAVQLHGDPTPESVTAVRSGFDGAVWGAYRVRDGVIGAEALALADVVDAIVLDAFHADALGGLGIALPWDRLASALVPLRGRRASIVLAGGLDPANVAQAVAAVDPDVVDVASGVERAPGIKDHQQLRAFANAVAAAARSVGRDE